MAVSEGERRILVTGARGYLGGRICRAITARPDLVLVGASRQKGPPADWPGGAFILLYSTADMALREGELAGVDTIIHLAAADQVESGRDPRGALDSTAGATVHLLEAAIASRVRRFIYVSTAHVYRTPLVGRIDELSVPRPAHPYAIAHRAAEDFVLAAHSAGRIQGIVLRLSNGIGAPAWRDIDRWTTVGNDLCRQAITKRVLTLSSSGEQWRDFITLEDIGSAMLHLIDLAPDMLADGLFNLGGAMPMRIIDVAECIAERAEAMSGVRPPVIRTSGAPCEPIDFRIDKILATGYRHRGNLSDEIDATLRLCLETFSPPSSAVDCGSRAH